MSLAKKHLTRLKSTSKNTNKVNNMYEYKVIKVVVKNAEKEMNGPAKQGWRVIEVSPDIARGMGLIVTLEREKEVL